MRGYGRGGRQGGKQAAGAGVELLASAFVLAHYSPYFNRALAEQWGGGGKQLEVHVDSVPAFRHLLEYMHSMGKELPQGGQHAGGLSCIMHV